MVDQKTLNQQFDWLEKEIDNFNDDQVLKITDNLLGKLPDDKDIKLAKIIAKLRLSQFDNIESLFPKKPSLDDGTDLVYSYAYYLYKKARYEDCLALIQKSNLSDPQDKKTFTLLEAQCRYKKGDIVEAAKIYLSVLEDAPVNLDNTEAMSNLFNCLAQVPRDQTNLLEKTLKLTRNYLTQNEDSLIREFFYNLALLYTNIGNFSLAKSYLDKFKQFMEKNDDPSDAESKQDLLMYDIQTDYIDSFMFEISGEESEKKFQRYAENLELEINDYYKIATKNNMIAFRDKTKELGDSIKKLDEILKLSEKGGELIPSQILDLKINKLILYLVKNKYSESAKLIEEIEKNYQSSEYLIKDKFVSCKYFLLFRTKKFKEVEELNQFLLSQLEKLSPTSRLPILLVNGEINRLYGNQKALIENLIRIMNLEKNLSTSNALHAIILNTLSKNLNLVADFQDIIKTIQNQTKDPHVISQIAELYIKNKNHQQAAQLYQQILQFDKDNVKALERLGYLYSFTDMKKAEEYLLRIPQVDIITDLTEIRRLEVDYLPTKGTKVEEIKSNLQEASKKIKKRKRKPRYPKGFDPSNPGPLPDPERWLPKLERAKYKKMAQKKGKLRGTQGAAAGQETVQTFQKGPSTANQEVSTTAAKSKKSKKKK